MSGRRFSRTLATVTTALVVAACSSHDVVLASLGGDDGGAGSVRCSQPRDCPDGSYCELATCGASSGTCQLFPAMCPGDSAPVCGCDGLTYFNDCLRKSRGVGSSTPGPCLLADATTCGGPAQRACPSNAVCAILLGPGPCPPDAEGACWVLPSACPMPPDGGIGPRGPDRWSSCQTGGTGCLDLCSALRTGGSYQRSPVCP